MKVPKNLKSAISLAAYYNMKAKMYEDKVFRWLEKHGLTDETCTDVMKNMQDTFIDCVQVHNEPDVLIKRLEELEDK